MALIGVLGGMGPLATVDFMEKVVRLTRAACDQEHLPLLVASLPHIPDRSLAILDGGEDPLPAMLSGIDLLNRNDVGVIAIPCNYWYAQLQARSAAPILHIGEICVNAIQDPAQRVAILGTSGTIAAGFYQEALAARGITPVVPDEVAQARLDASVRAAKANDIDEATVQLSAALAILIAQGVRAAVMACTEIPLAARNLSAPPVTLIDSTLELARATVAFAVARGWNAPRQTVPDRI
ncbi:cysteate racemase [Paraburkholderia gardini]|uniref:aspartate/glutamate racemase family protein n=1 Tax=Paraburkholderia gardini TaxID=2823469 RepID=UPI001D4071D5|nr:amino acid racemase [Paraburkholderia gardini]CAG4890296.1 Aspartate racemase [Paraburkholderia gardini]